MTLKQDIVNTFDVLLNTTKKIINNSNTYINAYVEQYKQRFPNQKNYRFEYNLTANVIQRHDVYLAQMMNNLLYMKKAFEDHNLTLSSFTENATKSISSMKEMLNGIKPETDRYNWLMKDITEYAFLEKRMKQYMLSEIPISYAQSGWKQINTDMWGKKQGIFELLVQKTDNKFYSTVKDVEKRRVYSNSTPFWTITDAMNAAVSSAVKMASESSKQRTSNASSEYVPKFVGKQGRLF